MRPRPTTPPHRPTHRGRSSRPPTTRSPIRAKHAISRLAAELHDRVAQSLWSVDAEIASAMEFVPLNCDDARSRLTSVREVVGKAYQDVRLTLGALRADVPFQCDLAEALARSLHTFSERTGIASTLLGSSSAPTWSRFVELHVLAIIQQGLDNIAQHANASNVVLSIESVPTGWVATLRDDGRGFQAPTSDYTSAGHYGLAIMRERAECFGGNLIIQSAKDAGTTLILHIPDGATLRR